MDPRDVATWRRIGDVAAIEWGGATWTLGHEAGRFGLRKAGEPGERLALRGLAAVGRRDDQAFTPASLVAIEFLHSRMLATFEPAGWNGLTIRAAWGPSRDGLGMDLEVQASTSTVGELRRLEVVVGSRWVSDLRSEEPWILAPRDRASAALSYDGRETDETLSRLNTLAVPTTPPPVEGEGGYVEFVHPQDASRTFLVLRNGSTGDVGYALFGYDLEKGVVLRARLRGRWLTGSITQELLDARHRDFLDEPPPLRTA